MPRGIRDEVIDRVGRDGRARGVEKHHLFGRIMLMGRPSPEKPGRRNRRNSSAPPSRALSSKPGVLVIVANDAANKFAVETAKFHPHEQASLTQGNAVIVLEL